MKAKQQQQQQQYNNDYHTEIDYIWLTCTGVAKRFVLFYKCRITSILRVDIFVFEKSYSNGIMLFKKIPPSLAMNRHPSLIEI